MKRLSTLCSLQFIRTHILARSPNVTTTTNHIPIELQRFFSSGECNSFQSARIKIHSNRISEYTDETTKCSIEPKQNFAIHLYIYRKTIISNGCIYSEVIDAFWSNYDCDYWYFCFGFLIFSLSYRSFPNLPAMIENEKSPNIFLSFDMGCQRSWILFFCVTRIFLCCSSVCSLCFYSHPILSGCFSLVFGCLDTDLNWDLVLFACV